MNDSIITSLHQTGWIKTYSGKLIQPLELKPDDVCIEDIAHALSRVCRFAGHCHGVLNVASHSIRVMITARFRRPDAGDRYFLTALLHDASEAYLGDIPRPLKRHPAFAFYREVEALAEKAISERFKLIYPLPPSIKEADDAELLQEMNSARYAADLIEDPNDSRREFLRRFAELGGVS